MGGLGLSNNSSTLAEINQCGGFRQREDRAEATADLEH